MMTSWEPVVDYLLENMQKQTYKRMSVFQASMSWHSVLS